MLEATDMKFNPKRLNEIKAELITMATTFGHANNVQKMHACTTAAMHCELCLAVLLENEMVIGVEDDNG